MAQNCCSKNFSYKMLYLKKLNFSDKISLISIDFVKIQIDMSYYVVNIKWQNGFVFHETMHAK